MFSRLKVATRKVMLGSSFLSRIYRFLNQTKIRSLKFLNDEYFARLKYLENTGLHLNLNAPKFFNEKLWWLKINYRTPLMTKCSDKVEVHEYLNEIGLSQLSNKIIGVYKNASEVPFDDLNGRFYLKCNHVSGVNALYDSSKTFDREKFIKLFDKMLSQNYYYQTREWNYKNIKPRILVEEFIDSNGPLIDYRFLCFDGICKLIFVDIETASEDGSHNLNAKRNVYNRNFELCDFTVGRKGFDKGLIEQPQNLDLMIEYAERISEPFPFCRVDLYNIDGHIMFGEITFYPGGGTQQFSCKKRDLEVASWISIV